VALELNEAIFTKSNAILEKTLCNGSSLTRDELALVFEKENIKTDNYRLSHLLFRAELEAIVCSGALKGNKQTYSLLTERVPYKKMLTRDEALAELAKRYFTSHCPATVQDFAWWSGLSITEARQGLESIKSSFISETIGDEKYWLTNSFSDKKLDETSVYLLPAFDEFLISYRDRAASLSLVDNRKAISDNGIFRPVIVENGQVIAVWKRTIKKETVIIESHFFEAPNNITKDKIKDATKIFEQFFGKKVVLKHNDK
jgi:hypothetical protein